MDLKEDRIPRTSEELINIADDMLDWLDKYELSFAETTMLLEQAKQVNISALEQKIRKYEDDEP